MLFAPGQKHRINIHAKMACFYTKAYSIRKLVVWSCKFCLVCSYAPEKTGSGLAFRESGNRRRGRNVLEIA
ncbi:hypothetical protein FHS90_001336 [Rufibacter quisquiliarum]|uniref:Uncharacterized protein n=1 Tax=Rufibacter quisquiliarum TaxID=1549639 RepID=A0A839GDX6_9BACT|nr:hypothetical protein [Rufibacter quisquiliarum]